MEERRRKKESRKRQCQMMACERGRKVNMCTDIGSCSNDTIEDTGTGVEWTSESGLEVGVGGSERLLNLDEPGRRFGDVIGWKKAKGQKVGQRSRRSQSARELIRTGILRVDDSQDGLVPVVLLARREGGIGDGDGEAFGVEELAVEVHEVDEARSRVDVRVELACLDSRMLLEEADGHADDAVASETSLGWIGHASRLKEGFEDHDEWAKGRGIVEVLVDELGGVDAV
jgi:hypothetical protein